jgi:hypothetical protein
MTRIVLNPEQLGQTASTLDGAAGEYQAIGAQVYGCDCGCMPADVASVVDSVTAQVRSALQGISSELGMQASDLSQRAGVSQGDGSTAVSAAWGGPESPADDQQVVVGGGFDTSVFGGNTGDYQIVVGGGVDTSVFGSPELHTVDVGGGFDTSVFGNSGGGQEFVVGGNFDIPLSPSNMTDGYLSLAAVVDANYRHIMEGLSSMGPVYGSYENPFLTSELMRNAFDAQRRLDVVMSPTYHDSSYFDNYGDYQDQFPVDIRPW